MSVPVHQYHGRALKPHRLVMMAMLSGSDQIPLTDALRHYHLRHRHTFAWRLRHVYNFYKPLLT
ncbi:MAG: hypothetical protein MJA27_23455 [Pseudanabaenales cyanobacterium]|nr:hypothetical protein [Pseudanabaenales cyanobacterium]